MTFKGLYTQPLIAILMAGLSLTSLEAMGQTNLITSFPNGNTTGPFPYSYNSGTGILQINGSASPGFAQSNTFTILSGKNYNFRFNLTGTSSDFIVGLYDGTTYTSLLSNPGVFSINQTINASTLINQLSNPTRLLFNSNGSFVLYSFSDIFFAPLSGPSVQSTQSSLFETAQEARGMFNMQSAALNNNLSNDCSIFDQKDICISLGGRYTSLIGSGANSTGSSVVGAYQVNPNLRMGIWVDKSLGDINNRGTKISAANPMFGFFGVWSENSAGLGKEFRLATGYVDNNLAVTRQVIADSEPGSGSSKLATQGTSFIASYGLEFVDSWVAAPYAGIRHTKSTRKGYAEASSADVTTPLSYGDLVQESSSALAGVRFNRKVDAKTSVFGVVGLEHDLSYSVNEYTSTGIDGLTGVQLGTSSQRTRPLLSAGAYFDYSKSQRFGVSATYRQEAFQSSASTSFFATYQAGF